MTTRLYTPVDSPTLPFVLTHADRIVSMGSCFSDEIGRRLQDGGFSVDLNPFGTLYNPASMASAIERIVDDREVGMSDLVSHDGLWHSWHHHGSFSRPLASDTLEVCNTRIPTAPAALKEATLLMATFGTAWVYEREGAVVANCHKLPPQNFERRMMSVEEIVDLWTPLLGRLAAFNPRMNILFTVSPIRHLADGAHGNQLSKSTLLLSVDRLTADTRTVNYFPAYEIVLDELRDYRFFGPDMVHPTPLAADIVYDRFQQACMSAATIQQAHNNAKRARQKDHIPLH